METRAERVRKSRKSKRRMILIYAHLYSLSLLISGLLINSKNSLNGPFSNVEVFFVFVLYFPCIISYVVVISFFEEKLGRIKMILPIIVGAFAGSIIWIVF